jgi:hypothetical protein
MLFPFFLHSFYIFPLPSFHNSSYCDVFVRMLSLLGNLKLDTPVVARQPKVKHFHGYACDSVLSRCMVAWQPCSSVLYWDSPML